MEAYAAWRQSLALDWLLGAADTREKARAARWAMAWGKLGLAARGSSMVDKQTGARTV
jgi:hypothetical protein